MGFVSRLIRRPQQLLIRRVNFQIHLWAGIILALYLTVIGVSGSILVFGLELSKKYDPQPWAGMAPASETARISRVIEKLAARYPHTHIVSVMAPTATEPVFIAIMQPGQRIMVACHPTTGEVLGEVPRITSRLEWIYDLHENLLARRNGRVANGIGAAALLLMALTGLINWWPGVQNWRRALSIDFRRRWKRINFDVHSAAGFWSLTFLMVWAASGVYFTWPAKALQFVERISPVVNSKPPAITVDPNSDIAKLDFDEILLKARSVDRGARWKGLVFPASRRSPLEMLMSRAPGIGRDYEDTIYFNPYNGAYIAKWQYGVNKSLGDWIIWLEIPLHFGTHWGLAVKCLWASMGLALPLLATTGLLMYWNRVLGKRGNQI